MKHLAVKMRKKKKKKKETKGIDRNHKQKCSLLLSLCDGRCNAQPPPPPSRVSPCLCLCMSTHKSKSHWRWDGAVLDNERCKRERERAMAEEGKALNNYRGNGGLFILVTIAD